MTKIFWPSFVEQGVRILRLPVPDAYFNSVEFNKHFLVTS